MPLKLGKKPARHAISFKFSTFFNAAALPTPPAVFGHYQPVQNWGTLGNTDYGDCVWAGAAHETMVWSLEGGAPQTQFTTSGVLSDYSAVTGFAPGNSSTDEGTDVATAAGYRQKTGITDATGKRHKIDSYVELQVGNVDELVLATYLLGAVGVGIEIPTQAMDAFQEGEVWDVPVNPTIDGGHYIPCVGRNSRGNLIVVTWGCIQAMTPAFYERFSDEAVAYVSLETLNIKNLSPEGFDADGLRKALAQLNPQASK